MNKNKREFKKMETAKIKAFNEKKKDEQNIRNNIEFKKAKLRNKV